MALAVGNFREHGRIRSGLTGKQYSTAALPVIADPTPTRATRFSRLSPPKTTTFVYLITTLVYLSEN